MRNTGVQHYLDPQVNCLFIHISGFVDLHLAQQYASDARQDPRYHNDFNVLTDLTDSELSMSPTGLRDLADFMNKKWPTTRQIKAALILDSDLAHGLARMYDVYSNDRANDPAFFHNTQPDLHAVVRSHFELPDDYQFPSFITTPYS
jgi:hypothetical protein